MTASRGLCAAGGSATGGGLHGVTCLSPVGLGGRVSESSSYRWIPAPAHVVEAQ
jgi:hypothetical protein